MNFMDFLAKKKPIIWAEVQKYLPKEGPFNFVDVVSEYPKRQGKYGRGGLILLSCEAFGGDSAKAVKTAAAMQICEDWILIHDDIEDGSEQRRNKPALHRIHGEHLAINAGDYLHMLMWKMLMDNEKIFDEKTTFRIMREFNRFLMIVAREQHYEIYTTEKRDLEECTEDDYYKIIYGKTCEYTINGSLRLGAIVAGKGDDVFKKIDEIGIPLGKAFQIQDDLLNITGKEIGKETGGDVFEGKITLMLLHLIKNANKSEREKILNIMRKNRHEKTPEEVKYIIKLMSEHGSVDYAKKKAEEFAKEAKEKLNKHFKNIPNYEIFESAIKFFAVERKL